MLKKLSVALGLALAFAVPTAHAFSFADEEAKDKAAVAPKGTGGPAITAACKEKLTKERVMVLVAERGNNGINTDQGRYGMHFQGIDRRLQKYGMRTMGQEEIKKQVAQAEIDAHFRNDPDAALQAAQKHGASMTLRGVISSRRAINPMLRIPEVYISIGFALVGSDGRYISEASASSESYSGTDTVGMAATLINEQADGVVRRLLSGYCNEMKR
ncbi:MAG: hypothetical protein Q8M20_07470 [Rhodocyclaceae bacterium]|nr:hypothetical protein [Rhodocyclaceae bacterium]MDZ4214257.1 hypothetical protein [Rhodocyclaceae bacterium]